MDLPRYHLVTFTWGNVSGIDREKGLLLLNQVAWSMIIKNTICQPQR